MMVTKAVRMGTSYLALAVLFAVPALAGTHIEKQLSLEPGGRFELNTATGSVEVVGVSGSGARVVITSKSDEIESKFDIDFQESAGKVVVTVRKKGSKLTSWFKRGASMKFEIEVPHQTELNIDTSGGSIDVEKIEHAVRLDTSGGSIEVRDVRGTVEADTSGGTISIKNVEGDVHADTSGGGISIESVRGNVNADTSGGRIDIEDVSGDVRAETSGGGIFIEDAAGEVVAATSGGPVRVSFAAGNARGGSISTSGGGITVGVDPAVNLEIDASCSGGSVNLDLPLTVQGKISRRSVRGKLGDGGVLLRLRTSGGGIRIEPR